MMIVTPTRSPCMNGVGVSSGAAFVVPAGTSRSNISIREAGLELAMPGCYALVGCGLEPRDARPAHVPLVAGIGRTFDAIAAREVVAVPRDFTAGARAVVQHVPGGVEHLDDRLVHH